MRDFVKELEAVDSFTLYHETADLNLNYIPCFLVQFGGMGCIHMFAFYDHDPILHVSRMMVWYSGMEELYISHSQ